MIRQTRRKRAVFFFGGVCCCCCCCLLCCRLSLTVTIRTLVGHVEVCSSQQTKTHTNTNTNTNTLFFTGDFSSAKTQTHNTIIAETIMNNDSSDRSGSRSNSSSSSDATLDRLRAGINAAGVGRGGRVKDGWHLPAARNLNLTSPLTSTSSVLTASNSSSLRPFSTRLMPTATMPLGGPLFEEREHVRERRDPNPTVQPSLSSSATAASSSSSIFSSPFSLSVSRVEMNTSSSQSNDDEEAEEAEEEEDYGNSNGNNNSSFPIPSSSQSKEEDVAIHHRDDEDDEIIDGDEQEQAEEEEEEDDDMAVAMRLQREEEESVRLAQQLMAEEAYGAYNMLAHDYLRNNQGEFSEADLAALQAAMDDGDDQVDGEDAAAAAAVDGEDEDGMTYELLMRLGENLGDVKTERWTHIAKEKIAALPVISFDPDQHNGAETNDCDVKCLICQYDYEKDEKLRRLPCKHHFHQECVDEWLQRHDNCPYCKHPIHND